MKAIHLIGPTGSGKTPLGKILEERGLQGRRLHHFDFGAELRKVAQGKGPPQMLLEEVDFIRRVLAEGLLLENEHFWLAEKIFQAFVKERGIGPRDLLVLNGLPRHEGQLKDMEQLVDIRLCVELTLDEETLFYRLKKDPAGDRRERTDDFSELVARKLRWYRERTLPLKEHYRRKGIPVIRLSVEKHDTGLTLYQKLVSSLSEEKIKIILAF